MNIPETTRYPPTPSKPPENGAVKKEKMPLRRRLSRWSIRWGVDLMLVWGAGCVSAGAGWIYPPAGLIAAGVLLITGGVLWARGGRDP